MDPDPREQPDGANRRRHGRVRLQDIDCSLGTVLDLSASGMRVRTKGAMPAAGSHLAISIEGLEGPIVVEALVKWAKRTGFLSREVGVAFENLNAELRRSLTDLAKTAAHNEFVRDRWRNSEDAA